MRCILNKEREETRKESKGGKKREKDGRLEGKLIKGLLTDHCNVTHAYSCHGDDVEIETLQKRIILTIGGCHTPGHYG